MTRTLPCPEPDDRLDLMAAALDHAGRGWHVFPLRPNTKRPALHSTERCPRTGACAAGHAGWEQRATRDPDRIRTAWLHNPYNIGLATGPSGLVVVDLDAAKPGETPPEEWNVPGVRDGQDVLAVLANLSEQPVPVDTFTVATPSGGLHLYYQAPDGVELRNTAGTLGWKVDTRAHGGYVVAPTSTVDGQTYTVIVDRDPMPLPAWLCERLRPAPIPREPARSVRVGSARRSRYVDAAIRMEAERVAQAPRGKSNTFLYAAALALGQLVAGGTLTEQEHRHVLLTAVGGHIAVGRMTEREALATIASGLRKGAGRPRQVA